MKLEMTVCNVCQDPTRKTKRYKVSGERGEVEPDLCQQHGAFLEDLLAQRTPRSRRKTTTAAVTGRSPRRTKSNGTPMMTMAEIEAQKATAR